jgi:hypothetical protein
MIITDAETFYRTFVELLSSEADDKHIARKLGCSRGEVKRRRQAFADLGIVTAGQVDGEKLNAWLASSDGTRAQHQWETHHRQQQIINDNHSKSLKGVQRPSLKRSYNRPKV